MPDSLPSAAMLALAILPMACAAPAPAPTIAAATIDLALPGGASLVYERGHRTQKPYVRHLRTPRGDDVLRDEPPGHEHHHGLMFALGAGGFDFWAERYTDRPGVQREVELAPRTWRDAAGGDWHGFLARIDWLDPKLGSCMLHEQRTLLAGPPTAPGPAVVTWQSRLANAGDAGVRLWGNPYFGLGMRLAASCDGATTFTHSDETASKVVRGDERLTPGRWCAATGPIGGAVTTVALFAHPRNPRTPTRFFTMSAPFAYLSATLDLAAQPLELGRGEALELTCAVALFEGGATPAEIETTWQRWASAFDAAPAR